MELYGEWGGRAFVEVVGESDHHCRRTSSCEDDDRFCLPDTQCIDLSGQLLMLLRKQVIADLTCRIFTDMWVFLKGGMMVIIPVQQLYALRVTERYEQEER
jgi:hypothetical protein